MLDSRQRGHGFELHWCQCVVVLEQDTYILVQPRKTRPCLTERLLMGRKNQIKQTKLLIVLNCILYALENSLSIVVSVLSVFRPGQMDGTDDFLFNFFSKVHILIKRDTSESCMHDTCWT